MLESWRMRKTPVLQLLPVPPCPGVVATDMILSRDQREVFNNILRLQLVIWNQSIPLCEFHLYYQVYPIVSFKISGQLDDDDDDANSDDDIYHEKNRIKISSYISVRFDTKNSYNEGVSYSSSRLQL